MPIGTEMGSSASAGGSGTWFVSAMVETADARSHRGDPSDFPTQPGDAHDEHRLTAARDPRLRRP